MPLNLSEGAQAEKPGLECVVAHTTHTSHKAISAKTNGFSAFPLTLPDVDQIGNNKLSSFVNLSIPSLFLNFLSHHSTRQFVKQLWEFISSAPSLRSALI